jgi:hypothetical protein
MRYLFTLLFLSILVQGCKKQKAEPADCIQLSAAITANHIDQAKTSITAFINHLPSDAYTSQNLDQLADSISGQCAITAIVLCFDCIDTLPSQTEIRVSVSSEGSTISKTIDITYTPDNKMKFGNMHD